MARPSSTSPLQPKVELVWLVGGRTILLVLALISALSCAGGLTCEDGGRIGFLFPTLAILFAFCGASAWWLKRHRAGIGFGALQLLVDALLCTGVIYVTGGAVSPFVFLYLPLVMVAAVCMSRTAALAMGGLSAAFYLALVLSLLGGILPPADGTQTVLMPTSGLLLQFVGLCSGMILIAVLTSYLVAAVNSGYELAAQSQRDLTELSRQQRELVDELPSGVITTDLTGRVTSINTTAAQFLSLDEQSAAGQSFDEVCTQAFSGSEKSGFRELTEKGSGEAELPGVVNGTGEALRVVWESRPIVASSGDKSGWMFLLHDVTRLRAAEEELALHNKITKLFNGEESSSEKRISECGALLGESLVMQKVFNLIQRVAPSDATVLITGESGTGKELVARAIHDGSLRTSKPFVPVNCGAIPETLIESQLFGHKKGSFTGAESDHIGLFRQADGGTIFLDEIGELPLLLQSKLLRALQERRVRPVGGDRDVPIDVRIIAATNRNLRREVESKRFRDDLFYRLNVISLNIPPLRERKEDIPLLVHGILKRLRDGDSLPLVPSGTMMLLLRHDYPGNVRELENILERALVLGGEVLLPDHLPDALRGEDVSDMSQRPTEIVVCDDLILPVDLEAALGELERRYILRALEQSGGVKKRAAELLGVNFRSFRYRLQKFELQ